MSCIVCLWNGIGLLLNLYIHLLILVVVMLPPQFHPLFLFHAQHCQVLQLQTNHCLLHQYQKWLLYSPRPFLMSLLQILMLNQCWMICWKASGAKTYLILKASRKAVKSEKVAINVNISLWYCWRMVTYVYYESKSPRIDAWGTPQFLVFSHSQTQFWRTWDILFLFLSAICKTVCETVVIPWMPYKCNLADYMGTQCCFMLPFWHQTITGSSEIFGKFLYPWVTRFHDLQLFSKSQSIHPTCIFWLMDFNKQSVCCNVAFRVATMFLKQNCSGTHIVNSYIVT